MNDIQSQIDEITGRLDDSDNSLQDFSDSLDSNISDIHSTLEDNANSINDLQNDSGQLTFPLSQDTIDLIKEQFPNSFAKLVAGTVTVTDSRISPTSVILLSVAAVSGTQGFISYLASAGSAVITSTNGGDTSTIAYLILN